MKYYHVDPRGLRGEHAYPETYLSDCMYNTGILFDYAVQMLGKGRVDFFVEQFMRSDVRVHMDAGHPHWVTRPGAELYDECKREFSVIDETRPADGLLTPMSALWAGQLYSYYQWFYDCPSADLVKQLTPAAVARLYRPWHEAEVSRVVAELGFPVNIQK